MFNQKVFVCTRVWCDGLCLDVQLCGCLRDNELLLFFMFCFVFCPAGGDSLVSIVNFNSNESAVAAIETTTATTTTRQKGNWQWRRTSPISLPSSYYNTKPGSHPWHPVEMMCGGTSLKILSHLSNGWRPVTTILLWLFTYVYQPGEIGHLSCVNIEIVGLRMVKTLWINMFFHECNLPEGATHNFPQFFWRVFSSPIPWKSANFVLFYFFDCFSFVADADRPCCAHNLTQSET